MDLTPEEEKEFEEWIKNENVVKVLPDRYYADSVYYLPTCGYKTREELYQIFKSDQGNKEVINPLEHEQSK